MRKQGKICVNLCNPWLNLFRVTASTKAQWNIKTLSKGIPEDILVSTR